MHKSMEPMHKKPTFKLKIIDFYFAIGSILR